jgi:[acyl-carrier-protein] S-malonyltransferase
LAKDLESVAFSNPEVPVVANIDAEPKILAQACRDALVRQVTGAVQWEACVRKLIQMGAGTLVEVGPGKVLTGLMRQIDRGQTALNVEDEASLQKVTNLFAAAASE